jgi:hypothetical protein
MATPTNREEFKDYCLRKLGHPVIEINIDDFQLEDRIDDALRFWQEYHFDGTEIIYESYAIQAADITNKYVSLGSSLDSKIISITKLLSSDAVSSNMFSIKYQMSLNDPGTYSTVDSAREMSSYWMRMSHLTMTDDLISGLQPIRFNRKTNKLYIDWNWDDVTAGDYIVAETHQLVDGTNSEVWNDGFLKNYATALIKEQWGMNLSKFEGVQLPGGVTLNGRAILEDARTEIQTLKENMSLQYELPVDFVMG